VACPSCGSEKAILILNLEGNLCSLPFYFDRIGYMKKQVAGLSVDRLSALSGDMRVVIGKLVRRVRAQSHFTGDLTWAQISVLSLLERDGPATVTMLAKAQGMRPQSMGANVSVLEAAGMIAGAQDPNDGRQTIFSLTPACRKLAQSSRAAKEDWLIQAIQKNFSAEEQEQLSVALNLLKRLVDD
jgi:DNA-binding MarR family transcriptional regulator